jgi:hypothetical protein
MDDDGDVGRGLRGRWRGRPADEQADHDRGEQPARGDETWETRAHQNVKQI